jgi:hypothetical protein
MAQAAVKTTTEETAPATVSKPVEVDPKRVQVDDSGFAWRTVLVRMPNGATQDDLRNPKIWARAQAVRQAALVKFDHLFILGFAEDWYARAIVSHATSTEAHLVIEKVGAFRDGGQSLYSDGTLEVFWDSSAFGVRRTIDQVRVITERFLTEGAAIAALRSWYPKVVG